MSTIKDVAKHAGVSISTVSYALSGTRPIAEKTRQRILRAVEELNYHPNLLASAMIQKRTRIIALLYPALSMSSFEDLPMEFILSITSTSYTYDYGLLLLTHPIGEPEIMRLINQGLVDGVILMEVQRQDARVALMKRHKYPFSLIGRSDNNDGVSFVDMDFYTSYCMAIEYLIGLGHHTIGFLPANIDVDKSSRNYMFEALRGFSESTSKPGIQGVILPCDISIQGGYTAMTTLLDTHQDLSAVIVGNDLIYNGAYQAIQEKGLIIPDDISVIAALSQKLADKYTPKITTISIPAIEMGKLGTELLIRQLEDSTSKPQQVLLPGNFTVSQTTGPRKTRTD